MKIKLEKETEITGEIWYKVFADNWCLKSSQDENKAREFYENLVINAQNGYPIKETISETEIPNP